MITFYHCMSKVRVGFLRQQIEKVVNKANAEKRRHAVARMEGTLGKQTIRKLVRDTVPLFQCSK